MLKDLPTHLDCLTPEIVVAEGLADTEILDNRAFCWICGGNVWDVWTFTQRCCKCGEYYYHQIEKKLATLERNDRYQCSKCKVFRFRVFPDRLRCIRDHSEIALESRISLLVWLAPSAERRREAREKGILLKEGGPSYCFFKADPWQIRVPLEGRKLAKRLANYRYADRVRAAKGLDPLVNQNKRKELRSMINALKEKGKWPEGYSDK